MKIYIIGIEGAGTSALAEMYFDLGYAVSGSDNGDHFYRTSLSKKGIEVFDEYSAKNIANEIDLVVFSTSIKDDNPEIIEARKKDLRMLSYPEALAELFNQKLGIAVCGTHGKTTTTAIIAHILNEIGQDPSAVVGSRVLNWGGNSISGKGDYFIIEADEYQNKLKYYDPYAVVLTSVDWDHPDFYPTELQYRQVFSNFVSRIPRHGFLVVYGDSAVAGNIALSAVCKISTYGFLEGNDFRIMNKKPWNEEKKMRNFSIIHKKKTIREFEIGLPGDYNLLNAAAAISVCYRLNLNMKEVANALRSFKGTARRFEYIGKKNGAILIDDYAHHPEEIKAMLKSARGLYDKKNIIALFHPHSFTRTEALLPDFAQSFDDADNVFVLDIYGSAREEKGNISSQNLVDQINRYFPEKAKLIPTIPEAVEFFKDKLSSKDVLISIGAGDVWKVTHELAGKIIDNK
ncbi:MAG: UDP-N-acetylmuramate-L-alanine ligase [Candidatus Moranbacteria bacterium GW2011_GWE2_35_2-]|nr:MAG: UDP-N-acetylmuramate-L-alanine ligase [Candidatus Moranbacteria bacterium GW2011_GWE2_35_2-]KKQ22816.1 MAG: UDP-N-acetylmuramate-L-alanine ligase [Candidatus Moranbacteria bacterium GW2011_GWF2_37_11]KKQ28827.1 MAG: UDP-N-acetylmuramate-L-alanine ligase [Candidatus Moranbacteria bacterium GW2011_GWD1_37_17]KKQ30953.1 MAG: UDP-N-acetylmuramate-L-alanine ligase [Candidatus Moranbacteria bacterium GW2011_GWE1_37_24]KKQ47695.1 MAG: UDP-N-acetylmuramate-L-alanine ligase [Candidatus Moranbact